MEQAGVISGWTIYEDDGRFYVRYEQVVAQLARSEPSVAKSLIDFILRRESGEA